MSVAFLCHPTWFAACQGLQVAASAEIRLQLGVANLSLAIFVCLSICQHTGPLLDNRCLGRPSIVTLIAALLSAHAVCV